MSKKVQTFGSEGRLVQALVAEKEQPYPIPKNWCWTRLRYISDTTVRNVAGEDRPAGTGGWTALAFPSVDPLYFHYYFSTELFLSQAASKDEKTMGDCVVPLPPPLEQRRIVTCIEGLFSRLNDARTNLQWLVDSDKARKAAILQKAFSGELTEKWREAQGVEKADWGNPQEGKEPTEEEKQSAEMVEHLFAKERQAKNAAELAILQVERARTFILDQAFRGELGTNDPEEEGAEALLKRILDSREESR